MIETQNMLMNASVPAGRQGGVTRIMSKEKQNLIIYTSKDGLTKIDVTMLGENLWLSQGQIAEIYGTTKQNVGKHIKHILEDKELDESSVVNYLFTTASDGKKYKTIHYNLDMIIALGYRIQSQIGLPLGNGVECE